MKASLTRTAIAKDFKASKNILHAMGGMTIVRPEGGLSIKTVR
jgi:hypothetical protein